MSESTALSSAASATRGYGGVEEVPSTRATAPARGFSIAFRDLRVTVPKPLDDDGACCRSLHEADVVAELDVLRGVDGAVNGGELLCILGPSGAGKTTMLDVLAGRQKAGRVSGAIAFSGGARSALVQARTGYVMQDDALQPLLTVRETLMFSSRLRVPKIPEVEPGEDEQRRAAKVDEIIRILHLERVADSRIGNAEKRGLSGGERRRVSIGEQLVHSPLVLFCDEVTSGLDAANARRVVLALRDLARTGCTVVCTLHQPSSVVFALTDRLMLLKRGRCVYFGPTLDSLSHFAALGMACPAYLNPADYLLDLVEDAGGSDLDAADTPAGRSLCADGADADDERDANAVREVQERLSATAMAAGVAPAGVTLPNAIGAGAALVPSANRTELSTVRIVGTDTTQVDLADQYNASPARAALNADIVRLAPAMAAMSAETISLEFDAVAHLRADKRPEAPILESQRIRVLTHRAWLSTIRDPAIMYFRTGAACGIAALIGVIFFQTTTNVVNALLFLMCVFSLFCLPAITRYTDDRLIFSREYAGGYSSPLAYSISGFLVELPVLMITVLIYGLIVYFLVGFRSSDLHFPAFLLIVFLVVNVCFAKAQMLSALASSTNAALAFFMVILVYSLLLGGFMITADQLPHGIQWLTKTSYFFFGFNALLLNEYLGVDDPQKNLVNLGFQNDKLWIDLVALTLFLVGFRCAGFAALKYLHRERR